MTKQTDQRQTAEIIHFPTAEQRAALLKGRPTAKAAVEHKAAPLPRIEFGNSWYHEAAIEEADAFCDARRNR